MHTTPAVLLFLLLQAGLCASHCIQEPLRLFHLIRRCQRSRQTIIDLENVATLEECFALAQRSRALALNYSPLRGIQRNVFESDQNTAKLGVHFPRRVNRRHFLDQPEEFFNCHALQCPESSAFTTMVNDSRFDYFSLYGDPPGSANVTCIPEVGVFQLNLTPETYPVAFQNCNKTSSGTLAHVASAIRTTAISKLLQGPSFINGSLKLAHIGLNATRAQRRVFKTAEKEDLECFLYRAWAPGHPKTDRNASCVALNTEGTWLTIDCERKLPYVCEVFTSTLNESFYKDACRDT